MELVFKLVNLYPNIPESLKTQCMSVFCKYPRYYKFSGCERKAWWIGLDRCRGPQKEPVKLYCLYTILSKTVASAVT